VTGQVCRVCGCTDFEPCLEGCSWAEADLCSACVGTPGEKAKGTIRGLRAAVARIRREKEELAMSVMQLQARLLVERDKKR